MSIKHSLYENYKKVYNKFTNVKTVSDFEQTGRLTAKEFVNAGDELVAKIPVWRWVGGSENVQPYLPQNKKCLVYKGAPCLRRLKELNPRVDSETHEDVDGFVITQQCDCEHTKCININTEKETEEQERILTWDDNSENDDDDEDEEDDDNHIVSKDSQSQISCCNNIKESTTKSRKECKLYDGEKPTANNRFGENKLNDVHSSSDDSDVEAMKDKVSRDSHRRLYDVYITYDKYYETPRMYLIGYASDHITPLTTEQMKEDIYHANYGKTVTIDSHPVLGFPCISIHPCRHAETMRELMRRMKSKHVTTLHNDNNDHSVTFSPQKALFLFLKFISTVVPTIEYDVTSGVDV